MRLGKLKVESFRSSLCLLANYFRLVNNSGKGSINAERRVLGLRVYR